MFKAILRVTAVVCVVNLLVSGLLLLNVGAPNPTGRRYSSAMVETRATVNDNGDIGLSGERVLAVDLGLPRNDQPDERVCFCNGAVALPYGSMPKIEFCRTCLGYFTNLTAPFRRIDFISPSFLGEAKNRIKLPYGTSELRNQLIDYALVSTTLSRPLWVYTRLDTEVDPEYVDMVAKTGGGVIRYYSTVPGYRDNADRAALNIAAGSGVLLALIVLVLIISKRVRGQASVGVGGTTQPDSGAPRGKAGRSYGTGGAMDNAIESVKNVREEWRENLDKTNPD